MTSPLGLYCDVDDFWQRFQPHWEQDQFREGCRRRRTGQLSVSAVMTILIHFHQSHYRHFKAYYTGYVPQRLRAEFPRLVSYERFVGLMRWIDAWSIGSSVRLPDALLRKLHRGQLHRGQLH